LSPIGAICYMWLFSPNINCKHGFSTRSGGVSTIPYDSLNLGGTEDSDENILANRKLALKELNLNIADLCNLKQVHGTQVNIAKRGKQEGDALVSNEKGLVLAVSIADCYPILFYDEKNKVIGAAHAGWRGTVGRIAGKTVERMKELGADPKKIKVAIGQGICQDNFEVGQEVISQFLDAGFPKTFFNGRYLDLVACNEFVLQESGIVKENIWSMKRCTFEKDFFSYRRDKGKQGECGR
jgi:YfiH family protein